MRTNPQFPSFERDLHPSMDFAQVLAAPFP